MKRPKVADAASERRIRRAKAASQVVLGLAMCAVALAGVKGGMLYDRFPSSAAAPWLDLVAVPLAAMFAGAALLLWAATDGRATGTDGKTAVVAGACGAGFVAWTAICLLHTPVLRSGLAVLGLAGLGVGIGLATSGACRSRRAAVVLLVTVVGVATLLAVIGLREYAMQWRAGNGTWRIFAGFAVPNFLAGLFVMTLPVTGALFIRARDRNAALVAAFAVILQAPALLLTQSRLGVMSLAVGLVAFGASALVIRSARKRGHAPASGGSSGAGGTRARLIVMAALVLVVGLAAARPVLSRLRASRDQSYSARFRVMTWEGVRAMVAARPVMGSGTGAFDVRYPGYARVGYTQHAHNSFLQVAAETGVPGLALLAAMIAAVLAIGARGLRSVPRADGPDHDALILAGLIAGLIGAIAHNVFDSDLYVPANAAIFGVVCGLTMAFARPATGGRAATARMWPSWARRIPTGMLGAGLLAAGAVAVPARSWIAEASAAMSAGDPYGALDAYRNASKLDPLDHDHRLAMAHVLNGMGEQASARQELVRATRLADIGKTWYRLGKHDLAAGDPASAVRSLERAHRSDPMHLRSRLALAEAYTSSGRRADAVSAYERMIRLYRSPVGRVRAIPEVVDWEYGIAFAGLAEAAIGDGRVAEAADLLDDAASVLRTLWRTRDDVMVRLRVTDDVMREATARYEWVLEQRVACLSRLGRTDLAQSAEAELSRFRQESEAAHGD